MIPRFPEFKKIAIHDRALVESYTNKYPPYSDFDFTSLWSWDTQNERMISDLNGNLVVHFTDYETHEPFLSFLGANKPDETASKLMQYAKTSGISPVLRLVPEESAMGIKTPGLVVVEDKDNFDYICSVPELATLKGIKYRGKRRLAQRFLREHPEARFEIVNPGNAAIERYVLSVVHKWEEDKTFKDHKKYEIKNEQAAIERVFDAVPFSNLVVSAIFIGDEMRAFSIDEIVPDRYCMGHFWKADVKYTGIYDFLAQQIACGLAEKNIAFWNWEQDLGLQGMRRAKMSYRPAHFLKKYRVSAVE